MEVSKKFQEGFEKVSTVFLVSFKGISVLGFRWVLNILCSGDWATTGGENKLRGDCGGS